MRFVRLAATAAGLLLVVATADARPSIEDPAYSITPWTAKATTPDLTKTFAGMALSRSKYPALCDLLLLLAREIKGPTCPGDVLNLANPPTKTPQQRDPKTPSTGVNVIDEVSKFLADRARLELKAWLLQRLVNDLCDTEKSQDELYFPRVCANAATNDAYALLRMEAALVRSARKDLTELPAFLIWRSNSAHTWGYVLTNLAIQAREGDHARGLIAGLAETSAVRADCMANTQCALYYLGLMAQVFEFTKQSHGTTTERANEVARFSLWLMHSHLCADVTCGGRVDAWLEKVDALSALLVKSLGGEADRLALLTRLHSIQNQAEALDQEIARLKKLRDGKASEQELVDAVGRLLDSSAEIGRRLLLLAGKGPDDFMHTQKWNGYMAIAQRINRISAAFQSGRYSEATGDTTLLLQCFKDEATALKLCQVEFPFYVPQTDSAAFVNVIRNTTLLAALADAKTGSEAQAVLNDWASPLGSWKLKRDNASVSIGAIVGGAAGREKLTAAGVSSSGNLMTVFAPVGVNLSRPCNKWPYCLGLSGTFGATVSFVDFGNLVSARLSGNDSDNVSETKANTRLRDIAAPGLFMHWGVGNTPWVIAVGYERTPGLRTLKLRNGQEIEATSSRWLLGIGMDIPLLFF